MKTSQLIALGLSSALFSSFFLLDSREALVTMRETPTPVKVATRITAFDNLSLEAKSAYVVDAKTGRVLFNMNGETQLPLASLTKLMTALVAQEGLSKDSIVSINSSALATEGESGLSFGERFNLKDLLDFSLVVSSNDGVAAVAQALSSTSSTVDEMNKRADEIGLTQTYFVNVSGLDVHEKMSGSYGSARDIAVLLSYTLLTQPSLLKATQEETLTVTSLDGVAHHAENTNKIVRKIPNVIASKTGFTDLAGGNLAIAFDAGLDHPVVAVLLGSSLDGRFEDMEALYWASIEAVGQAGY